MIGVATKAYYSSIYVVGLVGIGDVQNDCSHSPPGGRNTFAYWGDNKRLFPQIKITSAYQNTITLMTR